MESKHSIARPALVLLGLFTLLTGIVYPLFVTAIGQALFPRQANGSLIDTEGRIVGSELIAQSFAGPEWFWPRPSAVNYDAAGSGGSNLGPTNPVLIDTVAAHVSGLRAVAREAKAKPIPVDLVTASGSGLDPHITPASARFQAARVAAARHVAVDVVERLIADYTEGRTFGVLGEPRVNVLRLNLAVAKVAPVE
jgi:K+-transporting ATPase ATPase C chain